MNLFATGLGEPMRCNVEMQCPTDLQDAMSLAYAFEWRSSMAVTIPSLQVVHSHQRLRPQPTSSSLVSPSMATSPATSVTPTVHPKFHQLSLEELAKKHKKGECYFCPKSSHKTATVR
jgi:hypothetical protein